MKDEWANFWPLYQHRHIQIRPSRGGRGLPTRLLRYRHLAGGRNLTINAGLRYELPGADAEKNNRATVLLPTLSIPLTNITGTLSMVSSSLYGARTMLTPYHDLFAPNIGFGLSRHFLNRYSRWLRHLLLADGHLGRMEGQRRFHQRRSEQLEPPQQRESGCIPVRP